MTYLISGAVTTTMVAVRMTSVVAQGTSYPALLDQLLPAVIGVLGVLAASWIAKGSMARQLESAQALQKEQLDHAIVTQRAQWDEERRQRWLDVARSSYIDIVDVINEMDDVMRATSSPSPSRDGTSSSRQRMTSIP